MKLIHQTLAPLASLKVQEKFIVNGTKDEYLLPFELLGSAINVLFERKGVSFVQSESLKKLKQAIQACDIPDGVSNSDLVFNYQPWKTVREKSKIYLKETGFDLDSWEEGEL